MKKNEIGLFGSVKKLTFAAMLAAIADFTFFVKKSVLAINSPFVLSAKAGKNLTKEEVGGAAALNKTGLVSFEVETLAQAGEKISMLAEIFREKVFDAELNESLPALNEDATIKPSKAPIPDLSFTKLEIDSVGTVIHC